MSTLDTVIIITNNGMGKGPQDLQLKLIGKYLELLVLQNDLPAVICFYTEGVHLVTEGSPVIERLQVLEAKGVRLIICSTCLNYYDLAEKVKIGIVGGMGVILAAQWSAGKVITL